MTYNPGVEKLSCPHCGKEIKAKKINKAFDKSHENDILDECNKCHRFIRKSHILFPNNLFTDFPIGICWFCETREADTDKKAHVFLKKDETSTYTGSGTRYEAKVRKVEIPRCSRCKKVQKLDKYIYWVASPLLVIVSALIIFISTKFISGNAMVYVLLLSFILGFLAYYLGVVLLSRKLIPDSSETKNIFIKAYYPEIKKYEEDGWKAQMDSQIG